MSEAARPADPERALARLASLLDDGMFGDVTAGDMRILLPLARAGLAAPSPVAADADLARAWFGDPCDAECSINEPPGSDGMLCGCQRDLADDFARERGANKFDLEVATRETERVRGEVAAFEKASGVRIQDWGGGNVGRLFRLAQSLDVSLSTARLDRVAVELREAVAALERASEEARDVASATPEPR